MAVSHSLASLLLLPLADQTMQTQSLMDCGPPLALVHGSENDDKLVGPAELAMVQDLICFSPLPIAGRGVESVGDNEGASKLAQLAEEVRLSLGGGGLRVEMGPVPVEPPLASLVTGLDLSELGHEPGAVEMGHNLVEGNASQELSHASEPVEMTSPLPNPPDALQSFLINMASAALPPILPTPAASSSPSPLPPTEVGPRSKKKGPVCAELLPTRSSGRLAAKPSCNLPSMEKAQLVLMKKGGLLPPKGSPGAQDLQRYRNLYKQALPDFFIKAISSLVDAASPKKGSADSLPMVVQA